MAEMPVRGTKGEDEAMAEEDEGTSQEVAAANAIARAIDRLANAIEGLVDAYLEVNTDSEDPDNGPPRTDLSGRPIATR